LQRLALTEDRRKVQQFDDVPSACLLEIGCVILEHLQALSSSTSIPLLFGMPVPCVSPPMSRLDRSPYAMNSRPGGNSPAFAARHGNSTCPCSDRSRTRSPFFSPRRAMSSGFICSVLVSSI